MRQRRSRREKDESSKRVIYAALLGNLLIAITKFIAAAVTGSSAMLSEGLHSAVDTGNELVLMYGMARARRRADRNHPLGHGRELYFWSFVVSLLIFTLGACVSAYGGFVHLRNPHEIARPAVSYAVLLFSAVFEFGSWWIAFKTFRSAKGDLSYWEAVRRSKDPPQFMVLLEDTAALLGIALAALGVFAATSLGYAWADGAASLGIGVLLAAVALLLARESKSLLIGEQADPALVTSVLEIARSLPEIVSANAVLTVQLAPDEVVAALSVELRDDLRTPQIEAAITELDRRVRAEHGEITALFVKPQTPARFATTRAELAEPIDSD